jgi:hypothetical protein
LGVGVVDGPDSKYVANRGAGGVALISAELSPLEYAPPATVAPRPSANAGIDTTAKTTTIKTRQVLLSMDPSFTARRGSLCFHPDSSTDEARSSNLPAPPLGLLYIMEPYIQWIPYL